MEGEGGRRIYLFLVHEQCRRSLKSMWSTTPCWATSDRRENARVPWSPIWIGITVPWVIVIHRCRAAFNPSTWIPIWTSHRFGLDDELHSPPWDRRIWCGKLTRKRNSNPLPFDVSPEQVWTSESNLLSLSLDFALSIRFGQRGGSTQLRDTIHSEVRQQIFA